MKTTYKIVILFVLALLITRCAKEKITPRDYPRLYTLKVTNVSDTGAVFNAKIIYRGDFKVLDYGFVWSDANHNPTIGSSDKAVYSKNIQASHFSSDISTTLKEGETYAVRAFVQTKDYLVYGDKITFLSLGSKAPIINSFSPTKGTWDDTISIHGKNFSYLAESNTVKLGSLTCKILSSSDSLLSVKIPETKNDSIVKLSVSILENTAFSSENFHYLVPKITSVEPLLATFGDTLVINGKNFWKNQAFNQVWLGDLQVPIISNKTSQLKVILPNNFISSENIIKVKALGETLQYDQPLKIKAPVIDSVNPMKILHPGAIITIKGKYFNPVASFNHVKIGGHNAIITSVSRQELQVTLPDSLIPVYNISVFEKNIPLTLTVTNQTVVADSSLQIYWQSTWTRKGDFPGAVRVGGVAFSINGKGYYGTGLSQNYNYENDFWEYDPETDHWTKIESLPGKQRTGAVAFVLNNEGYVGLGSDQVIAPSNDSVYLKDFYKYNPDTGHWIKLSNFTGTGRVYSGSFAANGLGYIVTGNWGSFGTNPDYNATKESWQYEPASDKWTQIANFPTLSSYAVGFNIGNTGYVYNLGTLYDLVNGNWNQVISVPGKSFDGNVAFSIGGKGYFGLGYGSTAFWEYDPNNQSFKNRTFLTGYQWVYGSSAFVIGDKAYVVGGSIPTSGGDNYIKEVWEFDPSKPN